MTAQTVRTSSSKCRVYQVVNFIHYETNANLTHNMILKGFQLWQEKKHIRK